MNPETLRARLARFPRRPLAEYPTPLQPLERLTAQIAPKGPRLWIKRDDQIGPATGGNKARKLEFLLADAQRRGAKAVSTFGGLQSNHARMTAAAARAMGLETHLFFFAQRPRDMTGNLLLDELFGARMHFLPGGGEDGRMSLERAIRLVRLVSLAMAGPRTYFIPVGGHNVLGCLGYALAAVEIHEQAQAHGLHRPVVITAAGTGGTLAGLLAGLAVLNSPVSVLGIDVGKLWKGFAPSIARLTRHLTAALGQPLPFSPGGTPLIEKTYVGPAYGTPSSAGMAAIRLLANTEGILLDPVYTGKAFAGMLDLIQKGTFEPDQDVIFLHTGGLPGLFAFPEAVRLT